MPKDFSTPLQSSSSDPSEMLKRKHQLKQEQRTSSSKPTETSARLLVIGQSRKVDLRELLTFELGPLPWSLASLDGMLAKTNKATLSKLLENEVECVESLPNPTTAYIIGAMALLQSLVKIP